MVCELMRKLSRERSCRYQHYCNPLRFRLPTRLPRGLDGSVVGRGENPTGGTPEGRWMQPSDGLLRFHRDSEGSVQCAASAVSSRACGRRSQTGRLVLRAGIGAGNCVGDGRVHWCPQSQQKCVRWPPASNTALARHDSHCGHRTGAIDSGGGLITRRTVHVRPGDGCSIRHARTVPSTLFNQAQ